MSEIVVALTTFPDKPGAQKLAVSLVEQHLAACVNILPEMDSIYRWKGKVEIGQEVQLVIKTRSGLIEEVKSVIMEQHPYELAEFLVLSVADGATDYLNWVTQTTHVN